MAAAEAAPAVLVTGGAGYIGSHACKALSAAGCRPVTYDDLSQGHRWAVRWGPLVQGRLEDAAALDAAIRTWRPVAVMHFAGVIAAGESVIDPAKYYRHNVLGMLQLLEAMRRGGIRQIVFSSSAAVYGTPQQSPIPESHPQAPISPYGASKAMGERLLQDFAAAYGIRAASLRYFNAVGADSEGVIGEAHEPETHLVPLVLQAAAGQRREVSIYGSDYPTADGTCVRDYVHVTDLAAAHVLALRRQAQAEGAAAFNLGTGVGASVRQVIDAARTVTGRPIATKVLPRRPGDPAVLVADPSLARRDLGWHPNVADLHQQIASAWRWQSRSLALTG